MCSTRLGVPYIVSLQKILIICNMILFDKNMEYDWMQQVTVVDTPYVLIFLVSKIPILIWKCFEHTW